MNRIGGLPDSCVADDDEAACMYDDGAACMAESTKPVCREQAAAPGPGRPL